ncbi:protein takeout-like [Trichoplusia ni]|uniref:Protein takeout-like n=1 Tax=Trichoplusia ni TaxID=7111 RepID=A0A7E5WWQ4_TRINI|nr:protein takeout-like [Trichoplusia ni]
MSRSVIILFCVIVGVYSVQYPEITPCFEYDSACLTRTSNILYKMSVAGDPSLNIENLDPMFQKRIDGNLATIKYTFHNTTLKGFNECTVVNSKLNLKKSTLKFDLFCPTFKMYGQYDVTGRLIVVPMEGNGDYSILCKDYNIHIDTEIKFIEKNGVRYMAYKTFKVDGDLEGKMVTELTNLFNGQYEELAAFVLRFINTNWKPVSKELQGPVFYANVRRLIKNFNKFLKRIPFDQLIAQ